MWNFSTEEIGGRKLSSVEIWLRQKRLQSALCSLRDKRQSKYTSGFESAVELVTLTFTLTYLLFFNGPFPSYLLTYLLTYLQRKFLFWPELNYYFWEHLNIWVVSHLVQCVMPWAVSLMRNSFSEPSTTSMLSSWFYLVYLIWYYCLSVKFVLWIVKQKIENKWKLFLKISFSEKLKWFDLTSNHKDQYL